jgi:aminoglycoside 6'-N-acetyltransferase I
MVERYGRGLRGRYLRRAQIYHFALQRAATGMQIRAYRDEDWSEWLRMSHALFPDEPVEELAQGMRTVRAQDDYEVFVIDRSNGALAGYVEVGTRSYADGCNTTPVAYIEAWYVDPDVRRVGLGRALLTAAEDWARSRGYQEMVSDALLENYVSHSAHERSGYQEVGRIVQYRKRLSDPATTSPSQQTRFPAEPSTARRSRG